MTRFARAKGSKSSNEKKPEEATSWAEMKNSMLSKKSNKDEEFRPKEEVKKDEPKPIEWASLGDNLSSSASLLKQNFGKKNKESVKLNSNCKNDLKLKRKREKSADASVNDVNSEVDESKFQKKKKKKKNLASEEAQSETNVTKVEKKNKKRVFTQVEEDSERMQLTKNKKKKAEKELSETVENQEQSPKNKEMKDRKKFRKMKKEMKTKYFKKELKDQSNSKENNQKQFTEKFNQPFKGKKKFKNREEVNSGVDELIINGEKIPIVKYQGFFVTLEDAERLKKLRKEMIKEGIPTAKLEAAIKLERRRAEKALSRLKKSVCFHCRGHGHLLSNCPKLTESENTSTGICYKCGSTEHSSSECKVVKGASFQFAECFICKEQGHIARQCPDNPRGLYPQGGCCRECGDVTHLRKDCPKVIAQKADDIITAGLRNDRNLECLDEEIVTREKQNVKNKAKKSLTVKF